MPFSHEPVYWDQEAGELFWELNARNDSRRVIGAGGGGGDSYVLPTATATRLGGVRSSASVLVDPATGVATVPVATTADPGLARLADAAAITAGTAGRMVDAAQLLAATSITSFPPLP